MLSKSSLCVLVYVALCSIFTSCQRDSQSHVTSHSAPERVHNESTQTPKDRADVTWLFIGDSLTAGYGLSKEEAYVHQLESLLSREKWTSRDRRMIKLINAGVSGDTSAGVLRRIDWLLEDEIERVFVCIGANDGLRGQPIKELRDNLGKIIKRVRARGMKVVLMGMKLPPNYGPLYTTQFAQAYADVAQEYNVTLLPYLLEGVGGRADYNQADGIHPNRTGQVHIASHIFEFLRAQKLISQ